MDKERLRKQIYDEIHAQFEAKLRELKRQKSQIEEELESVSERARSERRRLNSEIDRLENALAESRDARKKAGDSKAAKGVDAADAAKIQAAAEEQLTKAAAEWEAERAKLRQEIARLEASLTEMLERSANPLRAGSAREKLESKLDEALRMKQFVEDEFRRAKNAWEEERLRLAGEIVKLRRAPGLPTSLAAAEPADPERIKDLEARLEESQRAHKSLDHYFQKCRAEWEAERARLEEALAARKGLEQKLESARAEARAAQTRPADDSAIAQQLQEVMQHRNYLQQQLDAANETIRAIRAEQAAGLREAPSESAAPVGNGSGDSQKLQNEVARIEGLIADISRLIEDPATELSTVIRKNVERAELEAYLKGILFYDACRRDGA